MVFQVFIARRQILQSLSLPITVHPGLGGRRKSPGNVINGLIQNGNITKVVWDKSAFDTP